MNLIKIIKEGYKDVDELNNIANNVIKEFSEKNYNLIYYIIKNDYSLILTSYLNFNTKINFYTKELDIIFKYNKSKNNNKAEYNEHNNTITIYNTFKIVDEIKNLFKYRSNKNISKEDAIKLFYLSCEDIKGSLVHELQHALDNIKSNGNYTKNKKTKEYFKNKQRLNLSDNELIEDYLNLPHEYWARFSQYILKHKNLINSRLVKNNFIELFNNFKKSDIIHFNSIKDQKDKKILIKALYKYWYLKHNNL